METAEVEVKFFFFLREVVAITLAFRSISSLIKLVLMFKAVSVAGELIMAAMYELHTSLCPYLIHFSVLHFGII